MNTFDRLAGTYEGTGGGTTRPTGKAFVEASYRVGADRVEVFGSSTSNAEGNYIAWKEVLRRRD